MGILVFVFVDSLYPYYIAQTTVAEIGGNSFAIPRERKFGVPKQAAAILIGSILKKVPPHNFVQERKGRAFALARARYHRRELRHHLLLVVLRIRYFHLAFVSLFSAILGRGGVRGHGFPGADRLPSPTRFGPRAVLPPLLSLRLPRPTATGRGRAGERESTT